MTDHQKTQAEIDDERRHRALGMKRPIRRINPTQ
jgi:hypothetical protein